MLTAEKLTSHINATVKTWTGVWEDEEQGALTPQQINEGECDVFANTVVDELVASGDFGAVVVDDDWFTIEGETEDPYWRHAWIYFEGKHYDAEAPEGVEDWMQLPFFLRHEADPEDNGGNFTDIVRKSTVAEERVRLDASVKAMVMVREKIAADVKKNGKCVCPHDDK